MDSVNGIIGQLKLSIVVSFLKEELYKNFKNYSTIYDMATTKDVDRTPSGRIKYRGESFAGFNKPKRTPGKSKKFAVLAKKGNDIKMVRYGDPNMEIKKDSPARRKSFRARHNCDTATDKFSARYWSCKKW